MLREDAEKIVQTAIRAVQPDEAVKEVLEDRQFPGQVVLVSVGKAGWQMAKAAWESLGEKICRGIVITKYGHVMGSIGNLVCREAGHPVPDENSFRATREALDMVKGMTEQDTVLFLLSGGGSALFEDPLVSGSQLQDITNQLLSCGGDISEVNTIRKRLSRVKGGRFAQHCAPAHVLCIALSDVLGNQVDMIASGPACVDTTTCQQALDIVQKYNLQLSSQAVELLNRETPKSLSNVTVLVRGSVGILCRAAAQACRELGYRPVLLTDRLTCQASQAGAFLAAIAQTYEHTQEDLAFIAGGETVVKVVGKGLGGRNQELALAAAPGLKGISNGALLSFGSDGTDGPTDAAGGYVDGNTAENLRAQGIDIAQILQENDAYHALEKSGGLIVTGPTGTNVNDVAVLLLRKHI